MYKKLCPLRCKGECNKVNCEYKHVTCRDNFLCMNPKCEYGHGINYFKRKILNELLTEYYDEEVTSDDPDLCQFPFHCYNKDCKKNHMIYDYDIRSKYASIIKAPTNAQVNYIYKELSKNLNKNSNDEDITDAVASSASTNPTNSPLLVGINVKDSGMTFLEKVKTSIEDGAATEEAGSMVKDLPGPDSSCGHDKIMERLATLMENITPLVEEFQVLMTQHRQQVASATVKK